MDLSLDDLLSGLEQVQQKKSKVGLFNDVAALPLIHCLAQPCSWNLSWMLTAIARSADLGGCSTCALPLGFSHRSNVLPGWQVRLSERNVVELVAKLRQLGLLGDELLYTTNGKEYVTRDRAAMEVKAAMRAAGGRIPIVSWPPAWQRSGRVPPRPGLRSGVE
jgi:hypothetical protein